MVQDLSVNGGDTAPLELMQEEALLAAVVSNRNGGLSCVLLSSLLLLWKTLPNPPVLFK